MKPAVIAMLFATVLFAAGGGIGVEDLRGEELPEEDREIVENLDLLENLDMLSALEWLMQGDGDGKEASKGLPPSGVPEEQQDGEEQ